MKHREGGKSGFRKLDMSKSKRDLVVLKMKPVPLESKVAVVIPLKRNEH